MRNLLIFLSFIIFGWEASVPLVYFASQGYLSLTFILGAGILGNAISDTLWYSLGRWYTHERLSQLKYFRTRPHHYKAISRAIRKRGYLFLFCSKFLYGLGTPTQILAGAYRLSFIKTFFVNILGSFAWLIFVLVLARGVQTIPALKQDLVLAQLVFAAFVVMMFGVHYFVGRRMKQYFNLESEEAEESDAGGNGDVE